MSEDSSSDLLKSQMIVFNKKMGAIPDKSLPTKNELIEELINKEMLMDDNKNTMETLSKVSS